MGEERRKWLLTGVALAMQSFADFSGFSQSAELVFRMYSIVFYRGLLRDG